MKTSQLYTPTDRNPPYGWLDPYARIWRVPEASHILVAIGLTDQLYGESERAIIHSYEEHNGWYNTMYALGWNDLTIHGGFYGPTPTCPLRFEKLMEWATARSKLKQVKARIAMNETDSTRKWGHIKAEMREEWVPCPVT